MKKSTTLLKYLQTAVHNFNYWAKEKEVVAKGDLKKKLLQGILFNKLKNTGVDKEYIKFLKPTDLIISTVSEKNNSICKLEINAPETQCNNDRFLTLNNLAIVSLKLSYSLPMNYKPYYILPDIKTTNVESPTPVKSINISVKENTNQSVKENTNQETMGQKTTRLYNEQISSLKKVFKDYFTGGKSI